MAEDKPKFGMQLAAGAANTILGQVGGMIFGKAQDKRQLRQQEKLNKLQIAGNKEMSEFERQQQMKMWEDTNYSAQVEQAKKAGMSISALYGGTGASGATAGGGSGAAVSGADAGDPNAGVGMGLQMASQLALMNAQKENIEADTANKKAQAEGGQIDNIVKGATKDSAILKIQEDANKALAEAVQSQQKQVINEETMQAQIKTIQENAIGKILSNEKATKDVRIKEAEAVINEFKANLAKQGISPETPWYVKMIADIADKFGISPLPK